MSDKTVKGNAAPIFCLKDDQDEMILTVEGVAVPGGVLYVTIHHKWMCMNSTFVKHENVVSGPKPVDYVKAYEFLHPEEAKNESSQ
jgi:hypothetical protein